MAPAHNWAHQQSIRGLGLAGSNAGEQRRRRRGGVAAGTRIPARIGVGQGNLLRCELQGVLGKALGASIGSECKQREEFDEEVATTTGAV
jgi:hypothetical protein